MQTKKLKSYSVLAIAIATTTLGITIGLSTQSISSAQSEHYGSLSMNPSTDKASLFATALIPVLAHPCPTGGCPLEGRMTGGGRLNEEIIVTHGFELHCDPNDDPNNLEINWDGGNHFHLEGLTEVRCVDDPTIEPQPPNAGFDRYEAFGFGKLNGVDGVQIYFELTDAGEPGTNDTAFWVIRDTGGNIVLIADADLEVGNHQAHKK